jgi:murein DD-endopeptidase MepM/ murein hydrolase activator NlpD
VFSNSMTVMVVPQKNGSIIRFNLSAFTINVSLISLACFIMGSFFLINDYFHVKDLEKNQIEIQQNIMIQKFRMKEILNSLSLDRLQLEELKDFEKKLRVISGFRDISPRVRFAGNNTGFKIFQNSLNDEIPFLETLEQLDYELKTRQIEFFQLEAYIQEQKDRLNRTPSVTPMKGYISSRFGQRNDPLTGKRRQHNGLDIVNNMFTPIISPADGVVVGTMSDPSFGYFLVIDHGYNIVTRYGHIAKSEVKVGQFIKKGDLIARMGNAGRSSGPHLHYEILIKDRYVNPEQYVLNF